MLNPISTPVTTQESSSFIEDIPDEILKKILQKLPPGEVPAACRVCKNWYLFLKDENFWTSYDIKTLLPGAKIFDQAAWERRVPQQILERLKFAEGVRPCLTRNQYREIRLCGLPTTKLTVLEFPQGYSYRMLRAINFDDTLGPRVNLWISLSHDNFDWEDNVADGFINQCTLQPHTIVITDEILPGSEAAPRDTKVVLARKSLLKVLDVATLHTFTHKEAPPIPGTYANSAIYPIKTICCELMDKTNHAVIGTLGSPNVSMHIEPEPVKAGVGAKWVLKEIKLYRN